MYPRQVEVLLRVIGANWHAARVLAQPPIMRLCPIEQTTRASFSFTATAS